MTPSFDCIATGIGSMPGTDAESAVERSLRHLPFAPIWPQLPQRDFREHMDVQYSESLPGLQVDARQERVSFDTAGDHMAALERFFESYLARDYEFFRISEGYAPGFYALLSALQQGVPADARYLKGHITGPLTAGVSFKDETGRDIVHNELFFDAVVKGLAMKAAWQIERLRPFGLPVIIFIDEPAMESLGSAFCAVSQQLVSEKINEIADMIHDLGGLAGIHCCGNADWSMIFRTRVDIVNFDAFGYMEKVMLYPADIRRFLERGGALAWGIVPTGSFAGTETADLLVSRLESGFARLGVAGVDRRTLLRQSLLTPSCGMGSLAADRADAILELLAAVSARMRSLA